MKAVFKWGIIGPGHIARQFAKGIAALNDAEVAAVASRSVERAGSFAEEFHVPRTYNSYQELADDPDIDAIYVATPHTFHCEHAIICLEAGKAVLCEKPMAVNARQAEAMISTARSHGVFLMEAMWTRFLPIYEVVNEWLKSGAIGEVRILKSDFGFAVPWKPEDRHVNLSLAGGALLDVGVYNLALASQIFQKQPSKIESITHLGALGIDEQSAVILGYEQGRLGVFTSAVCTFTPNDAWICGTAGTIHIPNFFCATSATLTVGGGPKTTVERPFEATGYQFEAAEVMRCVTQGKKESDVMPLDETLQITRTMDEIRAAWGLRYACDEKPNV